MQWHCSPTLLSRLHSHPLSIPHSTKERNRLLAGDLGKQAWLSVLLLENTEQRLPHASWLLGGINAGPDACLLVVTNDWCGLLVVGNKTLLEGLGVVVGALNQRLTGDIVLHVGLWWVEDLVVRASGGWVNQATGDASDKERVVDLELDGVLEWGLLCGKHRVEALGLDDGTWEAVEDETRMRKLVF